MNCTPEYMTWYDPVGKVRDRVRVLEKDPEALELLRDAPDSGVYVETYSY